MATMKKSSLNIQRDGRDTPPRRRSRSPMQSKRNVESHQRRSSSESKRNTFSRNSASHRRRDIKKSSGEHEKRSSDHSKTHSRSDSSRKHNKFQDSSRNEFGSARKSSIDNKLKKLADRKRSLVEDESERLQKLHINDEFNSSERKKRRSRSRDNKDAMYIFSNREEDNNNSQKQNEFNNQSMALEMDESEFQLIASDVYGDQDERPHKVEYIVEKHQPLSDRFACSKTCKPFIPKDKITVGIERNIVGNDDPVIPQFNSEDVVIVRRIEEGEKPFHTREEFIGPPEEIEEKRVVKVITNDEQKSIIDHNGERKNFDVKTFNPNTGESTFPLGQQWIPCNADEQTRSPTNMKEPYDDNFKHFNTSKYDKSNDRRRNGSPQRSRKNRHHSPPNSHNSSGGNFENQKEFKDVNSRDEPRNYQKSPGRGRGNRIRGRRRSADIVSRSHKTSPRHKSPETSFRGRGRGAERGFSNRHTDNVRDRRTEIDESQRSSKNTLSRRRSFDNSRDRGKNLMKERIEELPDFSRRPDKCIGDWYGTNGQEDMIPKGGYFYEHDNRDEPSYFGRNSNDRSSSWRSRGPYRGRGRSTTNQGSRGRGYRDDKFTREKNWEHDKFAEMDYDGDHNRS